MSAGRSRIAASVIALTLTFAASATEGVTAWPVTEGQVVAGFGKHRGIDIAATAGTPVQSFRAGIVVKVDVTKGCGHRVQVRHAQIVSTYCNLDSVAVAEGQPVAAGAELARIAAPAAGRRAHLHFEVQSDGKHVDPMTFLPRASSAG